MFKKVISLTLAFTMFFSCGQSLDNFYAAQEKKVINYAFDKSVVVENPDLEYEKANDPEYAKYNSISASEEKATEPFETVLEENSAKTNLTTAKFGKKLKHDKAVKKLSKVYGIDISKWQGTINWKKVKKSGVKFAFIRIGYRGSDTAQITLDRFFERNIKEAHKYGIKIGIYFYTNAKTPAEAWEEGQYVVETLKDYEGYVTFPVAYDIESNCKRTMGAHLTKAQRTELCNSFCEAVADGGYEPCVYANKAYLQDTINMKSLKKNYYTWVARYNTQLGYFSTEKEGVWQFSDCGRVKGIKGNVDMDVAYIAATPAKPDNIRQTEISDDTIDLKWDKVSGADSYTVVIYDEAGNKLSSKKVKMNSTSFSNLEKGNAYEVRIRTNKIKKSKEVNGMYTVKMTMYTTPDKAKGLELKSRKANSITLKWSNKDGASGYSVNLIDKTNNEATSVGTTSKNTYTVKKLAVQSKNYFSVKPYVLINGVTKMYGEQSEEFSCYTTSPVPSDFVETQRTEEGASIDWKEINNIDGYQVVVANSKGEVISNEKTTLTGLETLGFDESSSYTVKVRTFYTTPEDELIYSSYAQNVVKKTPGKVKTVKTAGVTANTVKLSWAKTSGADGYKIYQYDENNDKYTVVGSAKGNSFTDKKLASGTGYKYVVKAYAISTGTKYSGEQSDTLDVKTAPGKVKGLKVKKLSKKYLKLKWKSAKGADGYKVYRYSYSKKKYKLIKKTTKTSIKVKKGKGKNYKFKVVAYAKK